MRSREKNNLVISLYVLAFIVSCTTTAQIPSSPTPIATNKSKPTETPSRINTTSLNDCVLTIESVGAIPFDESEMHLPAYKAAWLLTAEVLKKDGEIPQDFLITIEIGEQPHITVIHLWYKSDFYPENCNKTGNPSGKSRDYWYDSQKQEIISKGFWQ